MNRQKFLTITGLSFLGTLFFSSKKSGASLITDCNDPITPPVPVGPYYKDEKLFRMNIIEQKQGTPVEYIFKVEDKHCNPVEGAIVDIWQCDAEGHYSDFEREKSLGQTWLRGYQQTDKNGECHFKSVFPGWYNGRITHVHVKVHLKGKNVLTTNTFFPKDVEDKIYQNPIYPKGPNPVSLQQDSELRGDKDSVRHDTLVMKVENDTKGNLVAKYTIALL